MVALLGFTRVFWLPVTLTLLTVITVLSLLPLETLPDAPGNDKLNHLVAYAALMFPVALRKPRFWLLMGLFFIAWGGLIELTQPYVNRYAEWQDIYANATGLILGVLLSRLANYYLKVTHRA